MYREHARLLATLQFLTDVLLSLLAFPLAYWTRTHVEKITPESLDSLINPVLLPIADYAWMVVLAIAWWGVAAYSLGLYKLSIKRFDRQKIRIVIEGAILTGLFLGFLSFALRLNVSRPLIFFFVFYQAALLLLVRIVVTLHTHMQKSPSAAGRQILIVGNGPRAREMAELIARYSEWGLRILGHIAFDAGPAALPLNRRKDGIAGDVLGSIGDLRAVVEQQVVDEIIFVSSEPGELKYLDEVLTISKELGIRTRVAANFFPDRISKLSMEFLEKVPVITFSSTPDHALSLLVKRIMDIVLCVVLFILLSPILLAIGCLVKLTSPGPMIYRQVRCGLYGRRFVLFKFRSMREGAEDVLWEIKHLNEMDGPVFKMRNDPRVTPLGRFLRKSSIDELPQLWNVLAGEMSLVGPRAPLPEEVQEYTGWQRRRLSVKPGITCLWQVSGRNEIDFHEWMEMDLQYIDNWSLLLDLKILAKTFPVVLLGKGAR